MSAVASRLRCRLGDRFHGSSLSRLRPLRRYAPAAAPLAPQQNLQQRRRESWGMGVPLQPLQPFQAQRRWSSSSPMPGGCLETYLQMKANGEIQVDPRQEVCMKMLDDLAKQIDGYSPKMTRASKPAASVPSGGGGFFGLFGGSKAPPPKAAKAADAPLQPVAGQKGLYLWGGTGTGKTFMMNMFYDKIKVRSKKRIHFHEWMIDVHSRLHKKQKGSSSKTDSSADDMVEQVAADMMKEAWLLCFDEFQVTHISDAIIMKRIFSVLFELVAVVVATSNRPPQDLYLNGLNRPLFLPFIPMLEAFTNVHDIGAEVDYRMCSTRDDDDDRVYLTPNGENEKKALEAKFQRVSHGLVREGVQVESQGRRIVVPRCAKHSDVAFFSFVDLCDKPLGAADYLAVGHAFHTVFVADIPRLTMQERDQVRRFITLIDTLYETHTKLVCTAALDPIPLFYVSDEERKTSVADEIFAWDRTVSRLMEMQSTTYLTTTVRSLSGTQFLGQYKLKSLSDQDFKDMWRRYDQDDNGYLDMDELHILLEDLLERQCGHRNLSDELFDICVNIIDKNKDGQVSFDEFQEYLSDFSTIESTMGNS